MPSRHQLVPDDASRQKVNVPRQLVPFSSPLNVPQPTQQKHTHSINVDLTTARCMCLLLTTSKRQRSNSIFLSGDDGAERRPRREIQGARDTHHGSSFGPRYLVQCNSSEVSFAMLSVFFFCLHAVTPGTLSWGASGPEARCLQETIRSLQNACCQWRSRLSICPPPTKTCF